jgi:hypothetical protein
MSMSSTVLLSVDKTRMKDVARLVFLEIILQAFPIESEGQRVPMSSAGMSCGTSRMTTEKVGFLEADERPAVLRLMGA